MNRFAELFTSTVLIVYPLIWMVLAVIVVGQFVSKISGI